MSAIPDQRALTILKNTINSTSKIKSNICDSSWLFVTKKIVSENNERENLHDEELPITTETSVAGPPNPKTSGGSETS